MGRESGAKGPTRYGNGSTTLEGGSRSSRRTKIVVYLPHSGSAEDRQRGGGAGGKTSSLDAGEKKGKARNQNVLLGQWREQKADNHHKNRRQQS